MFRLKSSALLVTALVASAFVSGATRAATYDVTFESGGQQVGSAVLTLQNVVPTSIVTINAANGNSADFVSLVGSIGGFTFDQTSFAPFANSVASNGEVGAITIVDGTITNIFSAFGGGGISTSESGDNLFFTNGLFNPPPLVFELGAISGTETVTAAVPEPSTWAMMILGFCGLGFMAYRRKRSGSSFRLA
jgi:hypothetical protein